MNLRKYVLGKTGLFITVSIIFCSASLFAGDSGRIQLSVPSPDPTLAGQKVTFQVIAVNSGSELWNSGNYFIEVEVYDSDKRYLLKSDALKGKVDVKPSSSILAYLPLLIPDYYSGMYYYKAFLTNNKVRLAQTEYIPFSINPLPIAQVKIPKLKIGGNVAVSYESNNSDNWRDFNGNLSMNLIGRMYDQSFLFNMYTISDEHDPFDLYTILFNFYGKNVTMGLGDIQPEFSNLSLMGAGMRGASIQYSKSIYRTDVVAARTVTSQEGSDTSDGVYRRMLYGIMQSVDLPLNITASADYVNSADAQNSVTIPGPTLTPEKNSVAGGKILWQPIREAKITGDFQSSSFYEDTKSTAAGISDTAYRADLEIEYDIFLLDSYFERINPKFYSFGAPSVDNDRQTMDVSSELRLFNLLSLNGGVNQYHDNLDNTKEFTTTQKTTNGGTAFTFPWNGGLNVNYSNSQAYGDDRSLLDNASLSMTFGLNQSFAGQNISCYVQSTEFEDKTGSSDNLETKTNGTNLNLNFKEYITAALGATLSKITDTVTKTVENTNSYSLSLNMIILKDKLTAQLWSYWNTDSDDLKTVDTDEKKASLEFTYQYNGHTTFTLGANRLSYADAINKANNRTETGANARVAYSF